MSLNYAQAIAIYYPNYSLTYVGDGTVYEDIIWNDFNPTGPIAKSVLDTIIANNVDNTTSTLLSSPTQLLELSSLGALPEQSGLIKKIQHGLYTLDNNVYLTSATLTSSDITNALNYIPYNSSNPSDYATTSYVDNLVSTGLVWKIPVHAFNFVGTASSPPSSANENENYIISNGGNIGAWSSYQVGDRVSWVGGQWVLREPAHIGCRLGICFDKTTTGVGDALGKDDYIGEIVGGDAINGWIWEWTAPQDHFAVFNNMITSTKFGQTYTYVLEDLRWIPFSASVSLGDGEGLSITSNVLNINTGLGISIANDKVIADLYPSGGLMTTIDGINSSLTDAAQLSLSLVGSAGTYGLVTTDVHGRVISGSNPTTLSGYGITEVDWSYIVNTPNTIAGYGIIDVSLVNLNDTLITSPQLGQYLQYDGTKWINTSVSIGSGTVTSVALSTPSEFNVSGSPITSSGTIAITKANQNLNTIYAGPASGPAAQPTFRTISLAQNDISDVNITVPTAGQSLIFNGTEWINLGATSGGGGAAKRIWSANVPSASGTSRIIPAVNPPLITNGTLVWTQTITPFAVNATYLLQTSLSAATSVNNANTTMALFRTIGGVSTFLGAALQITNSSTNSATLSICITDAPNTTSNVVYSLRIGSNTGTWFINRRTSEDTYGGLKSGWAIWEY